jgi:hypothetical protein
VARAFFGVIEEIEISEHECVEFPGRRDAIARLVIASELGRLISRAEWIIGHQRRQLFIDIRN